MMRIVEAGIAEGEPGTYALTIHGDKASVKAAAALFGQPIQILPVELPPNQVQSDHPEETA